MSLDLHTISNCDMFHKRNPTMTKAQSLTRPTEMATFRLQLPWSDTERDYISSLAMVPHKIPQPLSSLSSHLLLQMEATLQVVYSVTAIPVSLCDIYQLITFSTTHC